MSPLNLRLQNLFKDEFKIDVLSYIENAVTVQLSMKNEEEARNKDELAYLILKVENANNEGDIREITIPFYLVKSITELGTDYQPNFISIREKLPAGPTFTDHMVLEPSQKLSFRSGVKNKSRNTDKKYVGPPFRVQWLIKNPEGKIVFKKESEHPGLSAGKDSSFYDETILSVKQNRPEKETKGLKATILEWDISGDAKPGKYTISYEVDYDGKVDEFNELNNFIERSFFVIYNQRN